MKNLRHLRFIAILTLSIFFSSCAHLVKLDYAQRNFNEAATIENAARFSQTPTSVSPDNYYRLAYAHVNSSLDGRGKKKLDEDGVLGNAYTIKALCEWKLGEYKTARNTAKTAITYLVDDENPNAALNRDAAVMKAMDALINIEEANQMVIKTLAVNPPPNAADSEVFYKEWIDSGDINSPAKIKNAIDMIDKILKSVPPKHEVRTYFGMSKMAALKVWSDALHFINDNSKDKALSEDERVKLADYRTAKNKEFKVVRERALTKFAKIFPEGKDNDIYKYWGFLLGG